MVQAVFGHVARGVRRTPARPKSRPGPAYARPCLRWVSVGVSILHATRARVFGTRAGVTLLRPYMLSVTENTDDDATKSHSSENLQDSHFGLNSLTHGRPPPKDG